MIRSVAFILISLMMFAQACGQDKIPLKEEELKMLPYKGNETLIFKSNRGDRDTIHLKDFKFGYPDGPEQLKYYGQKASIHGNFSDPNPPGDKHRYIYGRLFELNAATPERETMLGIFLKAKGAAFYGPDLLTVSQLNSLEKTNIHLNGRLLKDVIIIKADTTSKESRYFIKRKNFVIAIYWSSSEGVVRYVKKDGEVWTKDN